MIKEVSYERVFNLGNFENERIGCVVTVESGDHPAAFAEARDAVEAQHIILDQKRKEQMRREREEYDRRAREREEKWRAEREAAQVAVSEKEEDFPL